MTRASAGLVSVVLIAQSAVAQAPSVSAPISGVHYDVTFTAGTAAARSFDVAMSFDVANRGDVQLSLPAWTPGAYEISNFARFVSGFTATQGGTALRWEKSDHDTWRVYPSSPGRITVRFRVLADTLDNAMAWTRRDFLMFNGTTAFLYPEGRGFDWGATVTVRTEPAWKVVTAMPGGPTRDPAGGAGGAGAHSFREDNYHDLVDHPFFVGPIDIDSAMVSGKWMRFATYPVGSVTGALRERIWTAFRAMTPPQVAVFGEVPWRTYTTMQIADSAFGGASGLEHQDSHVDIIQWRGLDNPVVLSLYAHEIFHAWNVKRLRPVELVPYRYDDEQPSPLLWQAEGVTDYYTDLSLVRGGVIDSAGFLATTEQKIGSVGALPPTSLEDASLSTWLRPRDGTHYVYYDHGSLAGLMLDVLIRDATNNRRSLDDVMRELWNSTYKRGRGFTNEEWWAAVDRAAGRSLADFRTLHVDGREPLQYRAVLPLAGIRVQEDTVRQMRLGVATLPDSGGMRVVEIQPGSTAAAAGVQPGDYLVAVGDVTVTGPEFGLRFRERYAQTPVGTPIQLRVRREGSELQLRGALQAVATVGFRLSADPRATEKARRIRSSLFRGGGDAVVAPLPSRSGCRDPSNESAVGKLSVVSNSGADLTDN
jgi:predicted metalloprotease with PDZ domain